MRRASTISLTRASTHARRARADHDAGAEDWRGWVLHVADGDGEEIFTLLFAALLGKPH